MSFPPPKNGEYSQYPLKNKGPPSGCFWHLPSLWVLWCNHYCVLCDYESVLSECIWRSERSTILSVILYAKTRQGRRCYLVRKLNLNDSTTMLEIFHPVWRNFNVLNLNCKHNPHRTIKTPILAHIHYNIIFIGYLKKKYHFHLYKLHYFAFLRKVHEIFLPKRQR